MNLFDRLVIFMALGWLIGGQMDIKQALKKLETAKQAQLEFKECK